MNRDLAELARATAGGLHGANAVFGTVSSDTRQIEPRCALRRAARRALRCPRLRARGREARRGGRGGRATRDDALPQVVVPDIARGALDVRARLAPAVRDSGRRPDRQQRQDDGQGDDRLDPAQAGPVLVTQGNLNNHIGVPLTLCRLEATHRHAVIEMGANHPGEIAHLAGIAEPTIGLVNNAGPAHLEGFGGLDGVARGKGELFEALGHGHTAVDQRRRSLRGLWRGLAGKAGRVLTFGLRAPADFRGVERELAGRRRRFRDVVLADDAGRVRADRDSPGRRAQRAERARCRGRGVCRRRRVSTRSCAGSPRCVRCPDGSSSRQALHGARLIDDSYNANPGSLRAGIVSLASLPGEHWLVLGEMAELGPGASQAARRDRRVRPRRRGVQRLLAVGAEARQRSNPSARVRPGSRIPTS